MSYKVPRFILKAANAAVSAAILFALLVSGTYAAFALWDNGQIYTEAENVREDMIRIKPEIDESEPSGGADFDEIRSINPDIRAWLTIDNTKIDYPVLQGENNLSYINTDVYGNFALAGSIYLDSRNDGAFGDRYSLLYGHHMADGNMFGDLDKFKDREFFEENGTGLLILPDGVYRLNVFACLVVNASDNYIFEPAAWRDDITELLDYAAENALYIRADAVRSLGQSENGKIIALSTCSSEFTDARTIVLAEMSAYLSEE